MTGSGLGIRATINARLEEVSFRTGMMTGAITLLGLAAVTAVAMITMMPGHGSPVNGAAVAPTVSSSPVSIAVVPVAARTSRTPAYRHAEVASTTAGAQSAGQSATQSNQPSVNSGSGRQYGSSGRRYDSTGSDFGGSTSSQNSRSGQQGYHGGYGTGGRNGAGQSGFDRTDGGYQGGF
jgi:hypothetical protein